MRHDIVDVLPTNWSNILCQPLFDNDHFQIPDHFTLAIEGPLKFISLNQCWFYILANTWDREREEWTIVPPISCIIKSVFIPKQLCLIKEVILWLMIPDVSPLGWSQDCKCVWRRPSSHVSYCNLRSMFENIDLCTSKWPTLLPTSIIPWASIHSCIRGSWSTYLC